MLDPNNSNIPDTATIAQAEKIRSSMSLTNLINKAETSTHDATALHTTTATAVDTACSELADASSSSEPALGGFSDNADGSLDCFSDYMDAENTTEVKQEPTKDKGEVAIKEESAEDTDAEIEKDNTDASTIHDVPDDQREFICVNDPFIRCMTGQYTKDLSRKVISDHFGRNKACTRDIPNWPLFCRKHYQRATYNKMSWQLRKIQLILGQFAYIESQHPGTTYDVQFKKSEEARLNIYSRQVASGTPTPTAAQNVAPGAGNLFEAPIDVLRELDQWVGRGKTLDDVRQIVDVIRQMLEEQDTSAIPAIEFLPVLPGKEPKTPPRSRACKSPKTPQRAKTPGKKSASPATPRRVSTRGSVKKTLGQA